jgi:uncharacterized protein (DUF488 family)
LRIFTIGHSTTTVDQPVTLLKAYEVNILGDVRSFSRSHTNPQFNQNVIEGDLAKHKIRHVWLQKLSGRRKGFGKNSKNACWKNLSFRNYADCMETDPFGEGIRELTSLTENGTVVIMCAEPLYWRCHRSMISGLLKSKGFHVVHMFDETHNQRTSTLNVQT